MIKPLVMLWTVTCATSAFCQTSAYQDTDSNTSIYLQDAKASLVYNVSDAKFTIGYMMEPMLSRQQRADKKYEDDLKHPGTPSQTTAADKAEDDRLSNKLQNSKWTRSQVGLVFSGKPSTDLTGQILQSSSSPASVSGGAYYGVRSLAGDKLKGFVADDWLTVKADFTRSTFSTIATASSVAVPQHFNGFSVTPAWDALWTPIKHVTLLSGISAGINRTNNTGDLSKVQVETTQVTSGTVTVVK